MKTPKFLKFIYNLPRFYQNFESIKKQSQKIEKLERSLIKLKSRNRDSIGEVLELAKTMQFEPKTIIDVGFNYDTPGLYHTYPNAKYLIIDPLTESEQFMQYKSKQLKDCKYWVQAAGAKAGNVTLSVPSTFGGSTIITDIKKHSKDSEELRNVPMTTLNQISTEAKSQGPYIIKIDTEGTELEVLKGADTILSETEMLIMESRVRPVTNAPQIYQILSFLYERGFVLYDIISRNYHDGDHTLKQFDIIAVKEEGFFRTKSKYLRGKKISSETKKTIGRVKMHSREKQLQRISGNREI